MSSSAQFVVDLPIAGGAFNYISLVFGELTAWYALPLCRTPHAQPACRFLTTCLDGDEHVA